MTATAEFAVVGLGAAGSAILQALARRGRSVIGIDRYHPPHTLGSTHGRSRIIREAYYESPVYVPLIRRAYEEWARIERECGRQLLWPTGGLMIGPPEGELVAGAKRSAVEHGLPHQWLTPEEIRREFPVFQVPDDAVGLLEPRAGFLDPEGCVAACLELAERHGAAVRLGATVVGWRGETGGIELTTDSGTISCGTLILSAGPWLPELIGKDTLPLSIERQVLYWFEPRANPERFQPQECPIFLWEWEAGRFFYGFPDHGYGFKAALHHEGRVVTTPDSVDRVVGPEEIAGMRALLGRTIPDAVGRLLETAVCLYTNTPDHHFMLGRHPAHPEVMLVSPCSGHGFKFASAVGEVVADLVTAGRTDYDLSPFSPGRFTASGKS